jgi:acetolactate decarboxylase
MGRAPSKRRGPEIFQVSTLAALAHGDNRGRVRIRDLLAHGDFGIGTFDHLRGELVVVDGRAWRVHDHEAIEVADPEELTPYAAVTRFAPHAAGQKIWCRDIAGLHTTLDSCRPSVDDPVAVRIDGHFQRLVIRVACGAREGERLVEAAGRQYEATHHGVRGTVVGFWTPSDLIGLDLAGYHLHALSDDRRLGGHVYDLAGKDLEVSMQVEGEVHVVGGATGPIDTQQLTRDLGTTEERPTR